MEPDAVLDAWTRSPDPSLLSPAALRLARRVPSLAATLDGTTIEDQATADSARPLHFTRLNFKGPGSGAQM